ncbi:MAG: hypothetical protein GY714_21110 [Desulfobacterales bacterium]|nr:hypothetical protein [Desulfobacterales bacterium]MCP4159267.1 hypothetical protein [Deltaproteobacteria bacterium]
MKKHNCEVCKFRKKYDDNSKSLLGKIWRWHINWCPGWKSYIKSLGDDDKDNLKNKYRIS